MRQSHIYLAIKENKEEYGDPVEQTCAIAGVSRAAYYRWLSGKKCARELENEKIAEIMEQIHTENPDKGYRRIKDDLVHDHKMNVNEKRVLRICRSLDIKSTIKHKNNGCTRQAANPQHIAKNWLNRQFHASMPNEKWLTDVTEFKWYEGPTVHKLYLSAILDLYDRRIVAFIIRDRNDNPLVFDTLDAAIAAHPNAHPLFHSDRGFQYAYSMSDDLRSEMFLLFSDQSMMSYTKRTESTYETVPQLLLSENIHRDDYEEYQFHDLDWLMKRGSITVSDDGFLTINRKRVYILKDLFCNEVICPNYYDPSLRKQVVALVGTGDLCYGSTLFSKPEQNYLNYILNKKEYSNGLDLRNKYAHDTCPLDEKTQQYDYWELQKIMVLIILKINEELCLKTLQQ